MLNPTAAGGWLYHAIKGGYNATKCLPSYATGYGIPYEYSNNLNDMNLPPRHSKADDSKVRLLVLPSVGPARPKRRCRTAENDAERDVPTRVIIPMESERPRPSKFKRSGQPFQIWTAPPKHSQESREEKPAIIPLFQELTRLYMRVTAALSAATFPPSP